MGLKKRKVTRVAPRFRFGEGDRKVIRFKSWRTTVPHVCRIFDISISGISFTVAERFAPKPNEVILMEFAPLNGVKMACQGRVIRVEHPSGSGHWNKFPDSVKIGVAFYKLPLPYERLLFESISNAFRKQGYKPRDMVLEKRGNSVNYVERSQGYDAEWFKENIGSFLATLAIFVVVGLGVWAFVENTQDTKPRTEAKWASGFFDKVIQK